VEDVLVLDVVEQHHLQCRSVVSARSKIEVCSTARFRCTSRSSSAIWLFPRSSISTCLTSNSGDFFVDEPVAALRLTTSLHALSSEATRPTIPLKLLATISEFLR
jgi:hypothetical protein